MRPGRPAVKPPARAGSRAEPLAVPGSNQRASLRPGWSLHRGAYPLGLSPYTLSQPFSLSAPYGGRGRGVRPWVYCFCSCHSRANSLGVSHLAPLRARPRTRPNGSKKLTFSRKSGILLSDCGRSARSVALHQASSKPPLMDPTSQIVPLPSSATPTHNRPSLAAVIADDRAIMSLIEQLLDRSGLPQTEIARRLGIRKQSLNQYRHLRRKRPSIQWIARLADACGARLFVEFPARPLQ
jgi:predicted XRE-type DNA-binding protein